MLSGLAGLVVSRETHAVDKPHRMSADVTPGAELRALTAAMTQGDEAAWRQFHDRYAPRLLRYLLVASCGREEAARDALQATFLRAVRHSRPFDHEDIFWSWLTVLARSALADELRKGGRYRSLLDRWLRRSDQDLPAPDDADAHLLELLERNLAALPADDRAVLERKYFEREAVQSIAHAQGTTEKAIESRLVRARRQLRDRLLADLKNENTR